MANSMNGAVELSEFQISYIFGAMEFGAIQAAIANKVSYHKNMVSWILYRYNSETFGLNEKQINAITEELSMMLFNIDVISSKTLL